jgi:hypothetical protein
VQNGDPKAAEELLPLVYDELRKLAAFKMSNEAAGQTLQPTALVHEPGSGWLAQVSNSVIRQCDNDVMSFQHECRFNYDAQTSF